MKYKVLSLLIVVFIFMFSLFMSRSDNELLSRTHQHLEYVDKVACNCDKNEFCTHLPIIKLDMDGHEPQIRYVKYDNGISDIISDDIKGTVEVIDNNEKYNHLADEPSLQVMSNIRIRGNSSKLHDKKNYKLSFINTDGSENKSMGLLGMEPHDEWALHGPYMDRSLIRNYMCMNIAGEIMPYTPDARFCELLVNGEYRGIYLAMETIARGKGRVNIAPYEEGDNISSYLVAVDWYGNGADAIEPFTSYTKMLDYFSNTQIVYPGQKLTTEIKEYITQEVSSYEKALYSFDYDSEDFGYKSFYNVDSFVNFIVLNEFFQNYDAGRISTYFYKDIGDKLHIGPVWDFNSALNNFRKPVPDFSVVHSTRFNMLIKDEKFVERLIKRYHELRKTVLSEEYLINYVDDTVEFLGPAVERNFEVWNNVFDYENMQDEIRLDYEWRNPQSYQESVNDLKEFIKRRGSWLDKHIETLRKYCHESATKKYNP